MDFFNNEINKRFAMGNFPLEKVEPVVEEESEAINLKAEAEKGLLIMKSMPFLSGLFKSIFVRVQEMEMLNYHTHFCCAVNVLINTGFSPDVFFINDNSYAQASQLFPAISDLEKILWYGAFAFSFENEIKKDNIDYEQNKSIMLAFVYLLKYIQRKELKYGYTINVDKIKNNENIIDLLMKSWENLDKRKISKLSDSEITSLQMLINKQKEFQQLKKQMIKKGKEVADETYEEWETFINVINDISQKEQEVIKIINSAGSSRDKIDAIRKYKSQIKAIEKGKYILNDNEINMVDLSYAIEKRFRDAVPFCTVTDNNGKKFILNPNGYILVFKPQTFNLLLMTFHMFRMAPSKDSAKNFISMALLCLKRNLNETNNDENSIDEMINCFYSLVINFVTKNKKIIEALRFEEILKDTIYINEISGVFVENDIYEKDLSDRVKEIEQSEHFIEDMKRAMFGEAKTYTYSKKHLQKLKDREKKEELSKKEKAIALQIIISLNIIYMFCDGLRIMLTNKHANIKLKDKLKAEQYRQELLNIDEMIIHKVYSNLANSAHGMRWYREKTGIKAETLTEQENQEDKFRRALFGDVLMDSVQSLVEQLNNKEPEQILNVKAQIREKIRQCPECEEKDLYGTWLDTISEDICNALVDNCKQKNDDYTKIKNKICNSLGEKSAILPDSTIDSLTTAEMLYEQFATEEYAEKGFDFSCISALYYQGFEEAYNKLIWQGYSDKLNSLEINGQKYVDILDSCKHTGIKLPEAKGYLDSDPRQRNYYIEYANRKHSATMVCDRCMYSSFAFIMEKLCKDSKLDKYCDYFAQLAGYNNKDSMFSDTIFVENCNIFINSIKESVDNRNNASHGGSVIDLYQCRRDKKTVLSDLETVRCNSIGLIQQLLFLLK